MKYFKNLFFLFLLFFIGPIVSLHASENIPDQALKRLMEGNHRFVSGSVIHPTQDAKQRGEIIEKQTPFAAILSCADSRVPPELIFDQGLGDLFVVRVAGNTVNTEGLGSLEYGVSVLGVPMIMVLGHTHCGAVSAALKGEPLPGHIGSVATPIEEAIQQKKCSKEKEGLTCAIDANVENMVAQLKHSEPVLAPLVKTGKLKVVGGVYDLKTGEVRLER